MRKGAGHRRRAESPPTQQGQGTLTPASPGPGLQPRPTPHISWDPRQIPLGWAPEQKLLALILSL